MVAYYTLPYGDKQLTFHLPAVLRAAYLAPARLAPAASLETEIQAGLQRPLDRLPVKQVVQPGERVTILVDDYTRATPVARILPLLATELNSAGIPDEQITILVSTGTHRACTPQVLKVKLGQEMLERIRVVQHDCQDNASHVFMGITGRGTPVWVNRLVVETERLFGIGHIDPSDYAGYSGGYNLIVPGVAALETIDANHSMATLSAGRHGHVDVPCRLDINEAGALIRTDIFINCVLTQDGLLLKAYAGSPEAVHQAGLELARQVYEVPCPEPVDIAITSAYPYDVDYYQSTRAIEYAADIVRPGGTILLAAACPDGIGSQEFFDILASPESSSQDFLRSLARRQGKVTYNLLGYFISRIQSDRRLWVYSDGLSAGALQAIHTSKVADFQLAIDGLLEEYGPHARIAILPAGSATLPVIKRENDG